MVQSPAETTGAPGSAETTPSVDSEFESDLNTNDTKVFAARTDSNRPSDVAACEAVVADKVKQFREQEGNDDLTMLKLEVWCNVYNVQAAEKALQTNAIALAMFNDTKLQWQKVSCLPLLPVPY